ncbi:MAG: flagellar hook-basal body complex protein FliE [bacterium]|nr:flagellar hook-basal body complex protein FliE [bacterium]
MNNPVDLFSLRPEPLIKEAGKKKAKQQAAPNMVDLFSEIMKSGLTSTNNRLSESEDMTQKLTSGEVTNIHDVMIAAEKAGIALNFTMEIRNKVIRAYDEIMRMR